MFEVSARTIYRGIDAISMAGIPIRSISGVSGGFEIMPEYKIEKKFFRLPIYLQSWWGFPASLIWYEVMNW